METPGSQEARPRGKSSRCPGDKEVTLPLRRSQRSDAFIPWLPLPCQGQNLGLSFQGRTKQFCFLGKWEVWDGERSLWRGDRHSWRHRLPSLALPPENRTEQLQPPSQPAALLKRLISSSFKKIWAQKKDWKEIDQNADCGWVWVKRRWVTFASFLLTSCFLIGTARPRVREAAVCARLPPCALWSPTPPGATPSGP